MKKTQFFKVNTDFIEYIQSVGFKHFLSPGEKQYYAYKNGKQIKIDFSDRTISFLNRTGNLISKMKVVDSKQIQKFIGNSV